MFDTEEYLQSMVDRGLEPYETVDFDTYQDFTPTMVEYKINVYPLLGLVGELAELHGSDKELGDVMWYMSETANLLGLKLKAIFNFTSLNTIDLLTVMRLAEIAKKSLRDGDFMQKPDHVAFVTHVLFHIAGYIKTFDVDLGKVMADNMSKLTKRKQSGTIKGDGDHR